MQGERDGHAPNGKQKVVVMPVSVAAARMRLPMPIGKHVARRFSMLLKNAAVCVASRVPLASLVPLCPRGSKKGAQLPPLWTTLVAPDPEDAASTILELDELWSFVLKKANDSWIWIALCRKTRQAENSSPTAASNPSWPSV